MSTRQRGVNHGSPSTLNFLTSRMRFSLPLASVAVAALTSGVSALPKISRAGRYLYKEDGTRFFIKGVAYQEQGTGTSAPGAVSAFSTFAQ